MARKCRQLSAPYAPPTPGATQLKIVCMIKDRCGTQELLRVDRGCARQVLLIKLVGERDD